MNTLLQLLNQYTGIPLDSELSYCFAGVLCVLVVNWVFRFVHEVFSR